MSISVTKSGFIWLYCLVVRFANKAVETVVYGIIFHGWQKHFHNIIYLRLKLS